MTAVALLLGSLGALFVWAGLTGANLWTEIVGVFGATNTPKKATGNG